MKVALSHRSITSSGKLGGPWGGVSLPTARAFEAR